VLHVHEYDGSKINIGGRQRMLSKKYSMETSAVLLGYVDNDQAVVDKYSLKVGATQDLWTFSRVFLVSYSCIDQSPRRKQGF
jgi:hypothetical protein